MKYRFQLASIGISFALLFPYNQVLASDSKKVVLHPLRPSKITIVEKSKKRVYFKWNKRLESKKIVGGIPTYYKVRVRKSNGNTVKPIKKQKKWKYKSNKKKKRKKTVKKLRPGTRYQILIKACNDYGCSKKWARRYVRTAAKVIIEDESNDDGDSENQEIEDTEQENGIDSNEIIEEEPIEEIIPETEEQDSSVDTSDGTSVQEFEITSQEQIISLDSLTSANDYVISATSNEHNWIDQIQIQSMSPYYAPDEQFLYSSEAYPTRYFEFLQTKEENFSVIGGDNLVLGRGSVQELWQLYSTDNGSTWTKEILYTPPEEKEMGMIDSSIIDGNLYIIATEREEPDISYRMMIFKGTQNSTTGDWSWSTIATLDEYAENRTLNTRLVATNEGNLLIISPDRMDNVVRTALYSTDGFEIVPFTSIFTDTNTPRAFGKVVLDDGNIATMYASADGRMEWWTISGTTGELLQQVEIDDSNSTDQMRQIEMRKDSNGYIHIVYIRPNKFSDRSDRGLTGSVYSVIVDQRGRIIQDPTVVFDAEFPDEQSEHYLSSCLIEYNGQEYLRISHYLIDRYNLRNKFAVELDDKNHYTELVHFGAITDNGVSWRTTDSGRGGKCPEYNQDRIYPVIQGGQFTDMTFYFENIEKEIKTHTLSSSYGFKSKAFNNTLALNFTNQLYLGIRDILRTSLQQTYSNFWIEEEDALRIDRYENETLTIGDIPTNENIYVSLFPRNINSFAKIAWTCGETEEYLYVDKHAVDLYSNPSLELFTEHNYYSRKAIHFEIERQTDTLKVSLDGNQVAFIDTGSCQTLSDMTIQMYNNMELSEFAVSSDTSSDWRSNTIEFSDIQSTSMLYIESSATIEKPIQITIEAIQ